MSATLIADVEEQVQKYWSSLLIDELKEDSLIVNLLNKTYEKEIKEGGDTVYVTQIVRPKGNVHTIGASGYDSYNTEKLSTNRIAIVADKVFDAGFEMESIAQLQSQIKLESSPIRNALKEAIDIRINDYIYSQISCTNKAGTVTDFNASQLSLLKKYAGQKKWRRGNDWFLLADSSYHSDLTNSQTLTSKDYIDGEMPVINGQLMNKRYNFGIFEDNSEGLLSLIAKAGGSASEDVAIAFHRDFMHLVLQTEVSFKLSSLHATKKRGYLLTAELIGGVKQGHDHNDLHKVVYNT
jgi:hypothetical protein